MIKLVVFDWNGTLIADVQACMAADNHVLKTFGGHTVNLKTYRNTIIIPSINFYSQHGCNKEELIKNSDKLGKVFHTFYEKRVAQIHTRKNAKKLLKWLKNNKIDAIILSNHTIEGINKQLKRLNIETYFQEVLANSNLDTSMKRRNKKEKLKHYLGKHKISGKEAMIVGDSPEEIEIGKALGLTTIAISNGYYSTNRLKKQNPHHLINNLDKLTKILKK